MTSSVTLSATGAAAVAEDVRKHFASGADPVKAVDGVSFRLPVGGLVILRGPSGCGKSTLLNLIGALERPDSGKLTVDGADLGKISSHGAVVHRRTTVGFVFQLFNLLPRLSAAENVALPMEFAGGLNSEQRAQRAIALMREVGLQDDRFTRRPTRLSGGEQQRVAIARALANNPKLVLADEPTANLDSKTGAVIIKLLRRLAANDRTVVIATHDDAVLRHADLILEMLDGKIVSLRTRHPTRPPAARA